MSVKTWYVSRNDDGTADVYRGDTSTPLDTVSHRPNATKKEIASKAIDGEISPELPEQANTGNAGNSKGLAQRGGELLHERAAMEVVNGKPPSAQ